MIPQYQREKLKDAINAFLDECERTAVLKFKVPETEHANKAILGLYDAVGRNP